MEEKISNFMFFWTNDLIFQKNGSNLLDLKV